VKFGRKPKLDAERLEHPREMLDQGKDWQHVARVLKVSRTTLYRALAC
jgi:DNA invertase Pin-like site-specific DNA recombinase